MPRPFPRALSGLHEIASEYDAFLVDLWGVVHDGNQPFSGVVDALHALSSAGRRVVFLTNTSRTGTLSGEMLTQMRIGQGLYETVISSGDITREALRTRDPALFALRPAEPRCVHLGDPSFVPWLFELGLSFVDDVDDTGAGDTGDAGLARADLVIATGIPGDRDASLTRTRERLAPVAARGVPLVCTNPDRVIPRATGFTLGPGAIAAAYEELGGRVFLYGKPHAPIYAAARRHLGELDAARIVAIGDLLETDVRGARDAGIASVLVTGTGGHAQTLGPAPTRGDLEALFTASGIAPDMLLPRFTW